MARRRVYLSTVGHILQELGFQYRRADKGEIEWVDAVAAARVLREMRYCIEGDAIEQRLGKLEDLLAERGAKVRPRANGRHHYEARP